LRFPRKRIVVLHLAGRYPLGGIGWQAIHYVLGLTRLGHDVHYVEDSGAHPYDPRVKSVVEDASYSVAFLADVMGHFGLADRWTYVDAVTGAHHGLSREGLADLYRDADAIFNVCGATRLTEEHLRCPIRVYVETDPVFEQIRVAEGDRRAILALEDHTHHFTYGENLGQPDCPIPLEKFAWRTTRPPVIPDLWSTPFDPRAERFTTVATWKNAGKDIPFRGETYLWSKHLNFLKVIDLPSRTRQPSRWPSRWRTTRRATSSGGTGGSSPTPSRSRGTWSRTGGTSSGRAESSRWRRISSRGRGAAGSATAACATWPPASRS
jgi:hypothetical protein